MAASGVGTAVFWGGGVAGAILLALFFTSGSLLSQAAVRRAPGTPDHGPRTARQVLANGTCATAGALALPFTTAGWVVLVGAIAAALADTWATEIGAHSSRPPRLITDLTPVRPGVSGGITLLGTVAGIAGALLVAGGAYLAGTPAGVPSAALAGGVSGMLVDSLLGATLQAKFHCPACSVEIERAMHGCGRRADHSRGLGWLDNDVVNLLGTAAGATVALAWWHLT